jgi:hypothetical protein
MPHAQVGATEIEEEEGKKKKTEFLDVLYGIRWKYFTCNFFFKTMYTAI